MLMKHLLDIKSLTDTQITAILDLAQQYANGYKNPLRLAGKVIFSLFFENSTRTRMSFATAAYRLGAQVVTWSTAANSMAKGENFDDTIATLSAMQPDAIIMRHEEYGAPLWVAARVGCPVINGGDSWRAHPTQALLDALTIRQARGDMRGLNIAFCGDVAHSRVAASGMELFKRLGAHIRIIAPPIFMPQKLPENVECFETIEEGLRGVDIIMTQRPQNERMNTALIDDAKFFADYGLTRERLALASPKALVLNPGPMRRGVEIADDVADDPQHSLILRQVANGVPLRMAVLDMVLNVTT